ncbi:TetR/AcrR family transcriptional regulator [Ideonella sp. TBM-1]|uniref:TetR/AcrR family transcriptional regulator n=2 Tax=Ideonella livida TaxID=2707176 RepID=A0A7C9TII2_9BURK|nr:TetR/AcrR family transcriptional regulator [Ideonella livida]
MFGDLRRPLGLPRQFTLQAFRKAAPVDSQSIWDLVLERHQQRMTVRRADKAQDNLRKLIEATFRLANKVGFVSMTLRDLSRETGLSMGGLYGYIASKDDLAAMVEDMIHLLGGAIPHWFTDHQDADARLDATLRGHIYLTELLQPWFYFVFMESRMLDASQRQVAKAAELQLHADIAGLLRDVGALATEQAELLAGHTVAAMQDWYVKRWKYRHKKIAVEQFADDVCAMTLRLVAKT